MNEKNILALKEKYYVRNYITMLLEGFFISFTFSIFSYTTVFPVYIQTITGNSFYIALIAVVYYGCSYSSSILSCLIGINCKSPKWTTICICGLERVGFLFIILSTFFANSSENLALTTFFVSFALYAVSAGMSSPVFSNMLGNLFHRDLGKFFGSYSLIGAASGVVASRIMSYILEAYDFPINYRILFILGLIMAVIASLIPAIGIKEVLSDEPVKRTYARELPGIVKNIVKTNIPYRRFVFLRILTGAAEMAIPFYIVKVSQMEGVTAGFVGTMTTVLLLSNMVAGKIAGYIGDRMGPMYMVAFGSVSGVFAALLAIYMPHYVFGYVLFVLVAFAQQCVQLSNNVAGIMYSREGQMIPVMVAVMGLAVAPSYIFFSSAGGLLSNSFPLNMLFAIALCVYGLVAVLGIRFAHENKSREEEKA